jgi:hypothetical protein
MGINALGSVSDDPVMPLSLTLVERYAKLKWLFLIYPIV